MDGGMCPHLVLPAHKLHGSSALDVDALALVETLCIGAHACERAQLKKDDRVLVVGAGPIGLSAYQFAQLDCENVVLADISNARLTFARNQLGIGQTLEIDPANLQEQIDTYFQGKPSVIMDATGHPGSMEQAFDHIGHGGRIVFLGIVQDTLAFSDPNFHRKELTILASRNAPATTFHHVIAQLEACRIDTRPWITHRIALAEVPEQLPSLEGNPGLLKAMVEIG
jgi:threonine dehydrogenase-like Zn-dependent dehydrogenase